MIVSIHHPLFVMLHVFYFLFSSLLHFSFLYFLTSLLLTPFLSILFSLPVATSSPFINFIFLPLLQFEERAQRHRQTTPLSFFIGIIIFRRYTITIPFFLLLYLLRYFYIRHTLTHTHTYTYPIDTTPAVRHPSDIINL